MIGYGLRVTGSMYVLRYVMKRKLIMLGFAISVDIADSLVVICSNFC